MSTEPVILLADDDRLALVTLGKGLRQAGYKVLEASSGSQAIKLCQDAKPDLAILDIRMPDMSGLEVAQRIQHHMAIPFVILSAYGDNELVKQAVNYGAVGYLVKPLDVPQLVPSIEAGLQRSAEIRKLRETEKQLNTALSTGRDISTAVGLIMERYRLNNADAFEKLRSFARSQRRKISEIAAEIVQAAEIINMPDHTSVKAKPNPNSK